MQPLAENASNIPPFLGKLWKMVNDPKTDQLICWNPNGTGFVIQNQAQFWYELLPLYYKHNNMSSFVRQLNMYGFHKISTVENGTMDSEKDEIQFFHPYFQKDQPELLSNIKRKVTTSKSENSVQNDPKNDHIGKVLTDVKNLHSRQTTVDTKLTEMKRENAVLWREITMLRHRHDHQQRVINKLIQFLIAFAQAQPSSSRIRVKRTIPLMLNESPTKKSKNKNTSNSDTDHDENIDQNDTGPTIHELDSEIEITPEELFEEDIEDTGLVTSPHTSAPSPHSDVHDNQEENEDDVLPDIFWDKPEFVEISQLDSAHTDHDETAEESMNDLPLNSNTDKEVFLNPSTQDTLLSNLNSNKIVTGKRGKRGGKKGRDAPNQEGSSDLRVAKRDLRINSVEDLRDHIDSTQSEIDQLKDILHGCNSFDANALLGLFNEESPTFGLSYGKNTSSTVEGDPMVSGNELATCANNVIDFNELFDESLDGQDVIPDNNETDIDSTVNTPMIIKSEPIFPSLDKKL